MVLTTSFDAPNVNLIAILHPTESISLHQQIIGRRLKLSPNKSQCIILDYVGNPHDIYMPKVGSLKSDLQNVPVTFLLTLLFYQSILEKK